MSDFLSDSIAKTSKDRNNIKNQFGGTGDVEEYAMMNIESVTVKPSNIIVKVDGTEVVRRRWDWTTTTQFENGVKSSNMIWTGDILQLG